MLQRPILFLGALCFAASAMAQSQATPVKTTAAPSTKAKSSKSAKTTKVTKSSKAAAAPRSSKNQLPLDPVVSPPDLSPDQLAIADHVYTGNLGCELGASVRIARDDNAPGYFDVQLRNQKYRMSPVPTTTGTIRLEDPKAGVMWLQVLNKSMLMNQKIGQRLADECRSPEQIAITEELLKNPPPNDLAP